MIQIHRYARLTALAALAALTSCASCTPPPPLSARCVKVQSRAELIGGPRALGEVGDFLLENGKVRFIVQDEGFSRGFGVFGGALLDADLVRPEAGRGTSSGGNGRDNFGEMFPAFFLQAMEPRALPDPNNLSAPLRPAIEIESAGGADTPAVLVVRGTGNDFLALTQTLNEIVLGDSRQSPVFFFETRYILRPGAQYLEMETRVHNVGNQRAQLPNVDLFGAEVPTPLGDVVLFGAGNKVFMPHEAGFDIRFRLQEVYEAGGVELPALPGLVGEFIASAGPDVSYGVLPLPPEGGVTNFAHAHKDPYFPDATEHSVHIPFIASAFTGVFQVLPPPELAANDGQPGGPDEMSFRRVFIVGGGDVAAISDVVYDVLGDATGEAQGRVTQDLGSVSVDGASILVIDERGTKVTQALTDEGGRWRAKLRPGAYTLRVFKSGYEVKATDPFTVVADATHFIDTVMPAPAELIVTIVEPGVGNVPAKATLMGTVPPGHADDETRRYLFDLSVGEPFRYTDMIRDVDDDVRTRRYIEASRYAADGVVRFKVRPGSYKLVVGRGIEYERHEETVELTSGGTKAVTAVIARVVDTSGYVSGDFHLHSQFSLDSSALLDDRIAAYAAEGVELAVSTDHNFIVDYQPTIGALGLEQHISSIIGLELTTIDRGHFNGFPLDLQSGALVERDEAGQFVTENIASRTYGSFEWALRTPQEIFDDLRALGRTSVDSAAPAPVIVQANHPRDAMLGYFNVYALDPLTTVPLGPSGLVAPNTQLHPEFAGEAFSFDFDAIEVFNGKRLDLLKTFTVPADAPRLDVDGRSVAVDPVSCCEVTPGEVLVERPPFPCDADVPDDCARCDAAHFARALAEGTCELGGDILFPSVADDWIRMLLSGKRSRTGGPVIATASSDSHDNDGEPGYPRTYLRAPSDEPQQLLPEHVVAAFTAGDVLLTNGPFLRVDIDGKGMGEVATASGGVVRLHVQLDSAPWIPLSELRVRRGVDVVETIELSGSGRQELDIDVDVSDGAGGGGDTLLVVEVEGRETLFPSIVMNEIPPLGFTEALGSIGANFGLGGNPNALRPSLIGITTPYALTNALFVDVDGDGEWTPPRAPVGQLSALHVPAPPRPPLDRAAPPAQPWVESELEAQRRAILESMPLRKRLALEALPMWLWPSNEPTDVRRVLLQFMRHAHAE